MSSVPSCTKNEDSENENVNFVQFERIQRQFLNELAMKRSQVEELQIELNSAKLKIHEQNRILETTKNSNAELEHTLSLTTQNCKFLEDLVKNQKESTSKNHVLQECAVIEQEQLRNMLQKAEMENDKLIAENNELKAKHEMNAAYQKDILNKDASIQKKIAEINDAISHFEIDQHKAIELSQELKHFEELRDTANFYREEFYKSLEKYKQLEQQYLVSKSTLDEFEKLSEDNNDIFQVVQFFQTAMAQWEKDKTDLTEQINSRQDIINSVIENYKKEKEKNIQECLREAVLEMEIDKLLAEKEALQQQLKKFNKECESVETQTSTDINHLID
ncbi:hypothetical protein FQA39_LY03887 [Lamprigera yunnana]|nr:hypothetical protein FQA39_LY03887 [Lamprigera yunnana]